MAEEMHKAEDMHEVEEMDEEEETDYEEETDDEEETDEAEEMHKSEELHKICTILDKLTLDSLTLMEQHIQNKIDVEKLMCQGESDLAKARYIMGQTKVSKLQLPCENSDEFEASAVGHSEKSDLVLQDDTFDLETVKDGPVNPMKWFGVLVPQALHSAQEKFKRAITYSVKCANLQVRLNETMNFIEALKIKKAECKKGLDGDLSSSS